MATDDLTPKARLDRAKRRLADDIDELVEARLEIASGEGSWVDQNRSPLGRRRHMDLARAGKLPSKKIGRRILIRREVLDAYIEKVGLSPKRGEDEESVEDVLERIQQGGDRK